MRFATWVGIGLAILSASTSTATADEKGGNKVPDVLNFKMKSLDGKEVDLGRYQGKVILIVNTASKCGYTPQYKGLESLHEKFADKGLVVLGVPSNDFGRQEPGSDEEISQFCEKNYGVKFDMLSKVTVKGGEQVPLYKFLTSKETDPKFAGPIKWNFTKFLIGRQGEIVNRFEPGVKPESAQLTQAIEAELAKK
jgi:glutathione peroxidase